MKRQDFVVGGVVSISLGGCAGHASALLPAASNGPMSTSKSQAVAMYSQAQQDLYAPARPLPANPILGEVWRFDGKQAPPGWAFCTGALLPIKGNSNLFKLLGKENGGDGTTTFALPKSRKFTMVIAIAGASPKSPRELAAIFARRPAHSL